MWLLRLIMRHRFQKGNRKQEVSAIDWADVFVAMELLKDTNMGPLRHTLESDSRTASTVLDKAVEALETWRTDYKEKRRKWGQKSKDAQVCNSLT